ncbi:Leucine-rich repeat transmembrane protein kinase [Prunus dulcis]|uniref:Leucine-rich repeat transmembrane protein kinase n=1 Tax=Prunus dulcis TaxID=3755 RepID=A0A4Y1RWH7_PRUDU|nr:Leucine-rich repeat transmembrane protein kinase [Prunus dulcis]
MDTNFSIKCGGLEMRGNDGILYEAEDSALGPATFNVTSTQKWAVSNAGFPDNLNQSFVETTLTQVSGADLTARLFGTSRVSPGSLRYYGLGLQNGPYTVTLQFAETGNLRRKDFDISKEADTPTTPGKKSRTGVIVGIAVPVGVFYICGKTSENDDDEDP